MAHRWHPKALSQHDVGPLLAQGPVITPIEIARPFARDRERIALTFGESTKASDESVLAYLTPLCATLPSGAAAASDMSSEDQAAGALVPVIDGEVS